MVPQLTRRWWWIVAIGLAIIATVLLWLVAEQAQAGWPGAGRYNACTGPACISYTVVGPSSGPVSVASSPFTVTLSSGTFSGAQTITIADGGLAGTVTPSVGAPGATPKIVTPTAASSSFTFTYTPGATPATITLAFTNAQGWSNAPSVTYISTGAGCVQGSLKFNGNCTTVWLQNGVISP
jgi:hypothetical protein